VRRHRLLVRVPATLSRGRAPAAVIAIALLLLAPASVASVRVPSAPPFGSPSPPEAVLPAPPATTTLVSPRRGGGFANGGSSEPAISESGRYVAFTSVATNLVPAIAGGTTPPSPAVFVRDRRSSTTIMVPLPPGLNGGAASQPAISADGNVVAFRYQPATSTVAAAIGPIVLAWDRRTGQTGIVSRTVSGTSADNSSEPSVSGNGRYVAYTSQNRAISRLDVGTNPDVFRFDRKTNRTVLVSVGVSGRSAGGSSTAPSISSDGSLVAFQSDAGDAMVKENTGAGTQVYVRDIAAQTTRRVSAPAGGGPANGPAANPAISGNGRYVAFEATASNLAPGDDGRFTDVLRRDLRTGTTVLVSVTPGGSPGGGVSGQPAISSSGRLVAFASAATDLVAGPTGSLDAHLAASVTGTSEVYLRDLGSAETFLVSATPSGAPGGGRSLLPAVGGDGRFVAFASTSPRLVNGDKGSNADVFLREYPPAPVLDPPVLDLGAQAIGDVGAPAAAVLTNTGLAALKVSAASIAEPGQHDFRVVADGCAGRILRRGDACTVSVALAPKRLGSLTGTLRVPDDATGSPRTARLRGTGNPGDSGTVPTPATRRGRIVLDPNLGPPGIVTVVTGTGFPAGAAIDLRWSVGITPTLGPIVADGSGRFRIQVLVLHGDVTGRRLLTASAVDGTAFAPVSAPMLVTPASVGPPGFLVPRFVDLPLMLLFRG
jgi:Tol biopolymer transport system component